MTRWYNKEVARMGHRLEQVAVDVEPGEGGRGHTLHSARQRCCLALVEIRLTLEGKQKLLY